jgi:hypothetical protein
VPGVGCCLTGCLRLVFFALWRALAAAALAVLLARIDGYVERRHGENTAGRVWRAYRSRGKKVRRGTPPDAASAIDTEGTSR